MKLEGEETPEGSQVLGTAVIDPRDIGGQLPADKCLQWPPPASPSCPSQASDMPNKHEPHDSGAPPEYNCDCKYFNQYPGGL